MARTGRQGTAKRQKKVVAADGASDAGSACYVALAEKTPQPIAALAAGAAGKPINAVRTAHFSLNAGEVRTGASALEIEAQPEQQSSPALQPQPENPMEVLGAATWLLAHTPRFRSIPISALEALIGVPYRLGQLRLYRNKGRPFAVAAWAYVSEDVEKRIQSDGEGLKPSEWKCGEWPRLMLLAAPFGNERVVLEDLRKQAFRGNNDELFNINASHDLGSKRTSDRGAMDDLPSNREQNLPQALVTGVAQSKLTIIPLASVSSSVSYAEVRQEDVEGLAPRLRESDLVEIYLASGLNAKEGLSLSVNNSSACFSLSFENQVAALFGVAKSSAPDIGIIWLLGSDDLTRCKKVLVADGRRWVAEFSRHYAALKNYISAANLSTLEWLEAIGFRRLGISTYGHANQRFCEMRYDRDGEQNDRR